MKDKVEEDEVKTKLFTVYSFIEKFASPGSKE